jgi:PAS domain S-box-containing protein
MSRRELDDPEKGWAVAQKLRSHPGRLRSILRSEGGPLSAVSLPLVFLTGLAFESFFALHNARVAEVTLNIATLSSILSWAIARIRRRTLDSRDPLLLAGSLLLTIGAGGCLFEVFKGDPLPELTLKTIGTVMILFALDRMERRIVLDALRSSEEYLESVFESMPDPLVVIGAGRRILAGNRVAIATFGAGILGKTCCEAYLGHEDCDDCTVTQAWDKRKPRFELVRDDRGARRYEVTTFPLFGPHGFSAKLIQQVRDVSAHAESEDRASLLHDVVNSVADPVLTLGLRGELRHKNRAAEAIFGGGDAIGTAGRDLLPFADAEDQTAFDAALREFTPWERETTLRGKDGQERNALLSLAPIRAIDDRLLGTVVIVRDVTEVKRLQVQLSQNEKLSALGEMVAGVAHELNNPLTAVFGFAQLLLAEDLPAEQKDEVRHIYTHAERCKKIIDGLLKFSRRHRAERMRANLNELVQSTVDLLGYQMRLADVRVEVELDPEIPDSMMDSFQIQQVLINLATNAQHAVQETGRAGLLTLRTRRAGAGKIVLEAEDNGCGMSDAVRRRIFDPFFTTKGVGKGTGLGLSISYGIVKEHGGSLTVTSRQGEGSTFRVELPIVAAAPGSATAARTIVHDRTVPRSSILVVDDEPIILELLSQFLRADGHSVVVAGSVDEGLREVERHDFDLVFSDWRMPGRGGAELYVALCARTPDFKGRVIFLSGDALGTEVAELAARDGNPVLNKPFTLESIRAAMAAVLLEPVEPLDATAGRGRPAAGGRALDPLLDREEIESPVVD